MATIELQIAAVPAQVRTARLVAVAAARRVGIDEGSVDDLRLAVGEAAARAVALHTAECPGEPVTVILDDDAGRFAVTVLDRAHPVSASESELRLGVLVPDDAAEHEPPFGPGQGFGLAVIRGLVDDVEVRALDAGTSVRMSWPVDEMAEVERSPSDAIPRPRLDL
ncbi:MAG: ATP-binding protein [Candidatus Nanopelagicales bacterium]